MFLPHFIASEAFLLLAGALLVPLYLCGIRLSIGKQLEKCEHLGIKLETCSDKAVLGRECLG
jgi:hypothetical protein